MKNCWVLLMALACLPSWAEGKLPIITMKYEIAGGESEDAEDDTLEPTSLRNTASLRVRQDADPATFWLTLRTSAKDYFQEAGDYSYLDLAHEGTFRLEEPWKLGYLLGVKRMAYADLDSYGLSNDNLSLKVGGSATFDFVKGTSLDAGFTGRYTWATNPADAFQGYALTAGLSSRLGEWLLGVRYRGEFRLPMGPQSAVGARTYNTGSVSFQWDPNR
jgi:hypothetical protein